MLYERWRQIATEHHNEVALFDPASRRNWTFAQLHAAQERLSFEQGALVPLHGHTAEFVITLLAAWRCGCATCPIESGQTALPPAKIPSSCAHLKTTSATTGAPRRVIFTQPRLAADADHIVGTMGLRRDWPNVAVVSLAHSYGFSNLVLPLVLHGIPFILAPSAFPESMRRAAEGAGPVTVPAVPAMWKAWHEAGVIPSNIRLAISAGAPLPLELEAAIYEARGLKLHNFYGSTECGGIAYDASDTPRTDATRIGAPLQGVNLTTDEQSCLVVASGAVGESYWPEPDPALGQGRFVTSDLVELRNGGVHLQGRASDVINVAGRKFSPTVVEQALARHPAVAACLVFGVASKTSARTDSLVGCVVRSQAVTEEELRSFLLTQLPAWQTPRHWWFVPALAPNHLGKLSRAEWRSRFLTAHQLSGAGNEQKAGELIPP